MKIKAGAIIAAVLVTLACQSPGRADESIVGYNRIVVPVNSDVLFTVPFNQKVETTQTVTGSSGGTITVAGAPFTASAYASAYYVRFITGDGAGLWATITANTTNQLTIDTNIQGKVTGGAQFRIYKHHTLGSFFPAGMLGVSYLDGTKVLFFTNNIASMATNKAAVKTATYNASQSRWTGSGINNNTVLTPETQFIIRNLSGSQTLQLFTVGVAPDHAVSLLIASNGDLNIGSGYPVPVLLSNSGLAADGRKVLFFNESATGQNKASSKTATYNASQGRWTGSGINSGTLVNPTEAVILRLFSETFAAMVTIPKPY